MQLIDKYDLACCALTINREFTRDRSRKKRKLSEDSDEVPMNDSPDQLRDFIDAIPTLAWSAAPDGQAESFNRRWLEYTGITEQEARGSGWTVAIHPYDVSRILDGFNDVLRSGQPFEAEGRLRRFDGAFRRFMFRATPIRDAAGRILKWYGINIDVEDRTRAEDALRVSEHNLQLIVDTIPGLIAIMSADGAVESVNRQILDYFGRTLEDLKQWDSTDAIHPEDLSAAVSAWQRAVHTGTPYEFEHRLRGADGIYRWFQSRGFPLRDPNGRILRWYNLLTDIDERKQTEEKLRRSEADLLEAQAMSGTGSWRHNLITGLLTISRAVHRIRGVSDDSAPLTIEFFFDTMHPDDKARVRSTYETAQKNRAEFVADYRIVVPDGKIKYLHTVGHPVVNAAGDVVEFVGTGIDVTEQRLATERLEKAFEEIKRLKEKLDDENLVLRQEIDHAFMFEEIVGSSAALKTVLSNLSQVAPTDSTVLILGETGTGKELIARAIHKRSRRSDQVFVSVNCAAIPPALIASELFGHEKGAFTGALSQRRGRFELANGGTIFLDEIGEMPIETQIALLRVLQERQFERVGGSYAIAANVRIIAATNRDLTAEIAAGRFRSDLFYRLNVFPIEVPPLRKRKEDIPILIEYFVRRYSEKMGKRIRNIDKRTLELCKRYDWPGNVRELQNIVERSLILCIGDTFFVDDAWLPMLESDGDSSTGVLTQKLQGQEREMIEAALAESKGRVAGAKGAAARLGIPPSTLESKIKQLRIEKRKFSSA
jgi:PAS domain S-box-containing protein